MLPDGPSISTGGGVHSDMKREGTINVLAKAETIDTVLDDISGALRDLNDRLDWLCGRIGPVLRPDYPAITNGYSDADVPERSQVANRLVEYFHDIQRFTNTINQVGSRIEL